MQRTCEACGDTYTTSRNTARFCGDRCRKRAERNPEIVNKPATPPEYDNSPGPLEIASAAELTSVGRLDTSAGILVLTLAHQIDHNGTDMGLSSLSREYRLAMAEATSGVATASDELDEVRARRAKRRSG